MNEEFNSTGAKLKKGKLGRIAIVGAGAVGSYYGARLAQSGEDVTFLMRSDYEHVSEYGLQVESVHGDFTLPNVKCENSAEAIGEVDLVIVAWKATANAAADEVLPPLLSENTAILTLQNGLGNCELYAEKFGAERVLGGLCFVCINRMEAGLIRHTASGLVRVGEFGRAGSERLDLMQEVFSNAGFPCEKVENLEHAQWMKLVWNIPFNGLAIAEGGVDTEVILKERGLEDEVRALMLEVLACAAAFGCDIPQSFIEKQIEITHPMKKYRPSSMIDFVEGMPVEVEAIWEEPLRRAKEKNLFVPRMEALLESIQKRMDER